MKIRDLERNYNVDKVVVYQLTPGRTTYRSAWEYAELDLVPDQDREVQSVKLSRTDSRCLEIMVY